MTKHRNKIEIIIMVFPDNRFIVQQWYYTIKKEMYLKSQVGYVSENFEAKREKEKGMNIGQS